MGFLRTGDGNMGTKSGAVTLRVCAGSLDYSRQCLIKLIYSNNGVLYFLCFKDLGLQVLQCLYC